MCSYFRYLKYYKKTQLLFTKVCVNSTIYFEGHVLYTYTAENNHFDNINFLTILGILAMLEWTHAINSAIIITPVSVIFRFAIGIISALLMCRK